MLLAGYAIGGLGVASVYAVAMLRGRRDHHHRLGMIIPLAVASIVMRSRCSSATPRPGPSSPTSR